MKDVEIEPHCVVDTLAEKLAVADTIATNDVSRPNGKTII
jgi:hypothetical protein